MQLNEGVSSTVLADAAQGRAAPMVIRVAMVIRVRASIHPPMILFVVYCFCWFVELSNRHRCCFRCVDVLCWILDVWILGGFLK